MNHEPTVKAESRDSNNQSRELRAGQPALGAKGPQGAKFLGWVLIQLWEPTPNTKGTPSNVNCSGDESVLFKAAAEELQKLIS